MFLAALFALFGFYTKSEGIYLILVANIVAIVLCMPKNVIFTENIKCFRDYFFLYAPFALPFFLYKWYFHLGIATSTNAALAFHPDILPYVGHVIFFEGNYGVFFAILLVALGLFLSFVRSHENLRRAGIVTVFLMVYINL